MDLSTLANVATALAVLTAVAFGLPEARRARHERAAHGLCTSSNSHSRMDELDDLLYTAFQTDVGRRRSKRMLLLAAVQAVGMILERVGYSVYAGMFLCMLSRT
jgi:hypothetical protein